MADYDDLNPVVLGDEIVKRAIQEINQSSEKNRRASVKRRHDIYRDGGRQFLVEQITREFGNDALNEMRLAPINLLKKIINKRAALYKKAAIRTASNPKDQSLVDFYTEELEVNNMMQKANRYYSLFSNTVIYTRPVKDELVASVIPSYLYSLKANPIHQCEIDAFIFNSFNEEGMIAPQNALYPATGNQSFSLERGFKTTNDVISSNEKEVMMNRNYIFWTDNEHFTTDHTGARLIMDPDQGPEQWTNPIGIKPVVNITKDRDNEAWAIQGEDMVDLTLAIQMGWTDLLTIAKHQGFSILTIVSEEEPKKLTIGINRAVWLKQNPNGPIPTINYVTGNSPLAEYKDLLMDLLGLLLTTNDMDPGSIGGKMASRNFTSGFHAMIAMSDNLEAVEMDKPVFQDAEKDFWEITKRWHNWMFDIGVLNDEARKLGKFSDDLEVAVSFAEIKPLESDQETITQIKDLRTEGLITKFDALKRLHPDLSDDQIQDKIDEIEEELAKSRQKAIDMLQGSDPSEQDSMQMSEKISNEDGKDEGEEPTPGKMVTAKMPSKPMPMQVQAKGK